MAMTAGEKEKLQRDIIESIDKKQLKVQSLADEYGISRQGIYKIIQKMIGEQIICKSGEGRGTLYELVTEKIVKMYQNKALAEDVVFAKDCKPFLQGLPQNTYDKVEYIFTEMFNNAIDHAEAETISCYMERNAARVSAFIIDDGIGIFAKIQQELGLPYKRYAILELSKGKVTTDPKRHTGEGIFFSSRIANKFAIFSDELVFTSGNEMHDYLFDTQEERKGTIVYFEIDIFDPKTVAEVFNEYECPQYVFSQTKVPVRLLAYGEDDTNFVSRSQARRLLGGFERFADIILDFTGVRSIQQAFADEIFRVFANDHPDINIQTINANEQIMGMIKHVTSNK